MGKLQQLDVFIGTNTKIGSLTLPVGTEAEFSFIYEDEWKHAGFPISPHIPSMIGLRHVVLRTTSEISFLKEKPLRR